MRIGVDLGGTKIEAIALSPGGQEIARLRVTTPRDYAACLDAIAALVQELDRAGGAAGTVGVGIPGTVVPQTGYRRPPYPRLRQRDQAPAEPRVRWASVSRARWCPKRGS